MLMLLLRLAAAQRRGQRWACEIDLRGARPAPAACAALGVAMGGRRAAADVAGLLVAIGRCWRRRGSAPRAGDDGPPRSSVRPPRHSPPHGDIDAAVLLCGCRPRRAVQLPGRRQQAALNDQPFSGRLTTLAPNSRAHARGASTQRILFRGNPVSGATRDPTDPLAPPAGRRRQF